VGVECIVTDLVVQRLVSPCVCVVCVCGMYRYCSGGPVFSVTMCVCVVCVCGMYHYCSGGPVFSVTMCV